MPPPGRVVRIHPRTYEIISGVAYEQQRPIVAQIDLIVYEWAIAAGYDVPDRLKPDPALMWEP